MPRKFIIQEDNFIMGNVAYHFDLKRENSNSRVEGGGYWHVDRKQKVLYLYANSTEFGTVTTERLTEVITAGMMEPLLDGYKVLHSHQIKFTDVAEDEWKELCTIKMKSMLGVAEEGSSHQFTMREPMMDMMMPKRQGEVPVRTEPKIGRNTPCPCESGKKYKKCCLNK